MSTLRRQVMTAAPVGRNPSPISSHRATFLLLSDWQLLTDWCRTIKTAFPNAYGTYLVGSALHKASFRDIDVRMIMPDEGFDDEFPDAVHYFYPRGKLAQLNTAFS